MHRKYLFTIPQIAIIVLVTMLVSAVGVLAATGTTDSPAAPGSTSSYTLEDIFQRLDTGAAGSGLTNGEWGLQTGTGNPNLLPTNTRHGVTVFGVTGIYRPGWLLHTTTSEVSTLRSVDMLSATDGWAVGDASHIYHYDGSTWSLHATRGRPIYSVDMLSATDGYKYRTVVQAVLVEVTPE